jgi:hypothetical protein
MRDLCSETAVAWPTNCYYIPCLTPIHYSGLSRHRRHHRRHRRIMLLGRTRSSWSVEPSMGPLRPSKHMKGHFQGQSSMEGPHYTWAHKQFSKLIVFYPKSILSFGAHPPPTSLTSPLCKCWRVVQGLMPLDQLG